MKRIRARVPSTMARSDRSTSELRGRLIASMIAFALNASALMSGAIQTIELSIILAFLSYVVISTALALRTSLKQKYASIDANLNRLKARLSGQADDDVGPWGIRRPSRDAQSMIKRELVQ